MGRLLDTGHREEARLIEELRAIGCEVWDKNPNTGEQFEWTALDGRVQCHADFVVKGLPESPKTPHYGECKTAKTSDFRAMQKKGLRASKPQHWAQVQIGMHLSGLRRGVYFMVCKETLEIYMERVEYNVDDCMRLMERAARVVNGRSLPDGLRVDDYRCKWCDHYEICHGDKLPLVSCATCINGPNHCGRCELETLEEHLYSPAWIGKPDEIGEGWVRYGSVINAASSAFPGVDGEVRSSQELYGAPKKDWDNHAVAAVLRVLGGEVEE